MVRRETALLLVVILGLSFIVPNSVDEALKASEMTGRAELHVVSYVTHAPFNITSDPDFAIQGWPGNGSKVNPYLIQNLNITSTNSACIWVMNTSSHFVIKDCLIVSPVYLYTSVYAIYPITLTNVSNGRVERNHIVNSLAAVSGYLVSNCSISNNSLSVLYQGLSIDWSNSTIISNNSQGYEPCSFGMTIGCCMNCTISLNEFKNITAIGITTLSSHDVHIVENRFTATTDELAFTLSGIQVLGGKLCTIQRNVLSGFGFSGMEVMGRNHTVQDNIITSCQTGIRVSTNNSTFTGNSINGSFNSFEMIQANDTRVYGNTMFGRTGYYETGIAMYGGYDSNIFSNEISQVGAGIYLQGACRFNVSGNSVTDGRYGFVFGWYSSGGVPEGPFSDCDIVNNAFDSGGVYPAIENYENWEFDTIRFEGNTVNGGPIGFFTNLDQGTIDGNSFAQLLLVSCQGVTVSGGDFHGISSDVRDTYYDPGQASAITLVNCTACSLTDVSFYNNTIGINLQYSSQCDLTGGSGYYNSWMAISLFRSADNKVVDVNLRNNRRGVELSWSYNCHISNCLIRDNEQGIVLLTSLNCTLSHNTIFQNTDAILLENSQGSEIRNNTVYWNNRGALLNSTSECLITQNNIYNNTGVGISLSVGSNSNEIFNNTFAYNTPNAICEGTSNHWDNQIDTGNWWSDYGGEGAYVIDDNDQDNFPNVNKTMTSNGSWNIDPLLLGIAGGAVGIVALSIIIARKRRIEVVD